MKRDINLQQLSRDHHHGLLLGWKIRQGLNLKVNPGEIAKYVNYFSKEALLPHFKEEENFLLNCLPEDDVLKGRTLQEHKMISVLINELPLMKEISGEILLNIADMINDHIRFEERELFPHIERILEPEQLQEIGATLESNHTPFQEDYPYEFWKEKTID